MRVDVGEASQQLFASLSVELCDRSPQLFDRGDQILCFGFHGLNSRRDLGHLGLGPQVHRSDIVALADQPLDTLLEHLERRQRRCVLGLGKLRKRIRRAVQLLRHQFKHDIAALCGAFPSSLGADQLFAALAQRHVGGALCRFRLGKQVFRRLQRIRSRAACRFGGIKAIADLVPLRGELVRPCGESLLFFFRRRQPFLHLIDPRRGALTPLGPLRRLRVAG